MLKNPFRELDNKIRKNSSDLLRKSADYNKTVNQRVRVTIMVVFCVFVAIFIKLVDIQIIENENYTMKLEAYTKKQQVVTPPRGEIVDRNGKVVVTNTESLNITYYPPNNISSYSERKWQLAQSFAVTFKIPFEKANEREWKDYYILVADDYGNSLLSEEELYKANRGELSNAEVYQMKISRITMDMIDEIAKAPQSDAAKQAGYLSNAEKKTAWPIMMLMESATTQHVSVIVENASQEDIAYLIEHKEDFPGFDVSADWLRSYPYGSTLRDVFGSISTRGLDATSKEYYLAQGYALNERVGSSGLELEYEDYLRGTRTINDISYDDESGIPILTPISLGKKGYDLQLTIDIDLQIKIDEIIKRVLEREKDNQYRKYFQKAFVALMDPRNGDIIAMSGQQRTEEGAYIPYASGNYLEASPTGSVVKLATLYMGLNEGVVKPGEIILDAPMVFYGPLVKKSAVDKGLINDIDAIAKSSNIYMFHIAMRLGGGSYVANSPLYLPNTEAYDLFRKYYGMFGLGVETGLDIPFESKGFTGSEKLSGKLLDFAIGQYDSYTPIQLLQYVSTVGTRGTKVQPHFLKQVYEINSDESVIYQHGTKVMTTLDGDISYLDRIVEGMRQCVTTTFCGSQFNQFNKDFAAKTGTAELNDAYIRTNSSIIGFAPSDNPTIAFACFAPDSNNDQAEINVCLEIMGDVMSEYYNIYQ